MIFYEFIGSIVSVTLHKKAHYNSTVYADV